jgi:hypothetical protein
MPEAFYRLINAVVRLETGLVKQHVIFHDSCARFADMEPAHKGPSKKYIGIVPIAGSKDPTCPDQGGWTNKPQHARAGGPAWTGEHAPGMGEAVDDSED